MDMLFNRATPETQPPSVAQTEGGTPSDDLADTRSQQDDGGTKASDGLPAPQAIAIIQCCDLTIGINVTHVREVIPVSEALQPMPSSVPGVAGCVALRGLLVPVLDLRVMLGRDSGATPGIIVVLTLHGQVFAILADASRRIIPASQLRDQDCLPGENGLPERLFPRLFLLEECLVAMLDPAALLANGIPRTRDTRPAARQSDISEQYLLFEIEGKTFLLPVGRVDGTVPETDVGGDAMVSGPCEGAILRHDVEMALINPLKLVGMPASGSRPRASSAIVLTFDGDHRIALRADRVRDIVHIRQSMIQPMPRILARRGDLFSGIVTMSEGVWHHVLDPDALRQDAALRDFAALARRVGAGVGGSEGRGPRGRQRTAILFRAGGHFAMPVEQVQEIVALPAAVIEQESERSHLCTLTHRNALLPIFALPQLVAGERPAFGPASAVIVTTIGGERVGLAVEETVAVDRVGFVDHYDGTPEGMVERTRDGQAKLFTVLQAEKLAALIG